MATRRQKSIAWQLSAWYAGSAFLLLASGTGFLYFVLARSFDRENTDYLTAKTRTLETLLRERPGEEATVRWEVEGESLAHPSIRVLSRVLAPNGSVLVQTSGMSVDLPPSVFPEPSDLNSEDAQTKDVQAHSGKTYRLMAANAGKPGAAGSHTLQVAIELTFERDLLAGYRRQLWIVLGAGLAAAIWIGRARSRLDRRRAARRLLGAQPLALGHRRRADHGAGSRRLRHRPRRQGDDTGDARCTRRQ